MGRFCLFAYTGTGLTDRFRRARGFFYCFFYNLTSLQVHPIRKKQRVEFGKNFVW